MDEISEVMRISSKSKCLNTCSKISYSSVGNWADDVIELKN